MPPSETEPATPVGRVRPAVDALPAYKPGKAAEQAEREHNIAEAIKLASNENPYPPPAAVVEAVAAACRGGNIYCDHRATAVREALADRLRLAVEQVTVGAGSVALLYQLATAYIDPGDEAVTPWISFEAYPISVQTMGGTLVRVPLTADHAFDLDAVTAAVTERTKLVLLATPNNPTGTAVSTAAVSRLLESVPGHVVVLVDEAYREFADPALGDPVAELLPRFDNVAVARTFSKAYGLASLRVGYVMAHPEVVSAIDKCLIPFNVNGLAQAAALAALSDGATGEAQANIDTIKTERGRLAAALTADGWVIPDAQANFVWMQLGDRTDEVCIALEQRGVVVRPFSGVGVRVTVGTPAQNDRFLSTLAEVARPR
ncbi:MAG: histidinol-phosphate transaminase [Acidimicrobiaceae bacterium]|nr:histidinol-phosphate transaminase [Acidimicrobiaceae bacterium]MXZ66421.1 histidinol-phosphate transaminase [Acidimicrobiaceae bacterium]MYF33989.1 histidinol-phosphate transaminase [Acidimicrobiaceae bacterium]MYG79392.1 histidinol-phosphate transaminase [Acidimicrobiaceae bacterium]MYJ30775.1 histidinol-phosphate transaminase [Acidimicrobiaceae bacterium]